MEITLNKESKVTATILVKMTLADYEGPTEQALKQFKKKANMPGFRPGMVPMALVKKLYGTEAKANEVNRILVNALDKYIRDNKLDLLGEPLPSETAPKADLEKNEDLEFLFDIALAPELTTTLEEGEKVPYYAVEASQEQVDSQVELYRQRAGKYEQVDNYQDKDMLKGTLTELTEDNAPKAGGLVVTDAILMPKYFSNDEQKELFISAKKDDTVIYNPHKSSNGNVAELASLLKLKKEEVEGYTGNFSYHINEITRLVPAELDESLFDQIYGKGNVSDVEAFRQKVKEELNRQYLVGSDYKFLSDVRDRFVDINKGVEYPKEFLKRLIKGKNSETSLSEEDFDKELNQLTWQLIKNRVMNAKKLYPTKEEVTASAKDMARYQFAQYGMQNIPEETLEHYAEEMLKDEKKSDEFMQRSIDKKLIEYWKGALSIDKKSITLEEFNKMFQ